MAGRPLRSKLKPHGRQATACKINTADITLCKQTPCRHKVLPPPPLRLLLPLLLLLQVLRRTAQATASNC